MSYTKTIGNETDIQLSLKSANIINDYLRKKHLSREDFADILEVTPGLYPIGWPVNMP